MLVFRRRSPSLRRVVPLGCVLLAIAAAAGAQTRVQIVHDFDPDPAVSVQPMGGLILGSDGNFYGTAAMPDMTQGVNERGMAFRMTPAGTVTVLHTLDGGTADGARVSTGLVQASDGAFYGTTERGGAFTLGIVYRITAAGVFTLLHSFAGGPGDGASPRARLIQAADGNLYGTTSAGGAFGLGTAFRMTLAGGVTLLHSFEGEPIEGARPAQPLAEGTDGNFYGLTPLHWTDDGHTLFPPTAFMMTPDGTVSVLRRFASEDGLSWATAGWGFPPGGLLRAADGAFYGTTAGGGAHRFGTIYRITPGGAFSKLHDFDFGPDAIPGHSGALMQVADGTMYGTVCWTIYGNHDVVTVFSITPDGTFTALHSFDDSTEGRSIGDGAPPVQAPDGSLYGTIVDNWIVSGLVFRLTTQPVNSFDGDSTADVTMYGRASGTWRLLTSASGYQTARTINWGGAGYTPVPADYDGDSRLDAAVYHAATGVWWVLTSGSDFSVATSQAWGGIGYIPVPGDYDGDRKADLAVYRPATGQWHILESRTGFTSAATFVLGGIGSVPVGEDYDADGVTDLAIYRPATGLWQILTSRTGFTRLLTRTLGGPGYTPVPGYYDADMRADIAVYDQANGDWSVLTSASDFTTRWTQGWGGTGYTAVPGDYDGDGRDDLAVYRAADGEWFILQSSTSFTTTLHAIFGAPGEAAVARPVRLAWTDASRATDYDGDGASDLAVYEPVTGTWSIRDSSTDFTNLRTIAWGGAGDTPVPGDYDGDGVTDVATFTDTSGAWSVQLTRGGRLTATLGSAGDVPVPRDYDGDLVTDPAVYHPSTGQWRALLSSTAFTFGPLIPWGGADWTPVPGDYDADGKADLGIYRSSTSEWRVLLAASNFTTQLTMLWGGPGQTAVLGDYDGDGAIDITVCRNTTGRWWVLKSGFTYTTAFGVLWSSAVDTPVSADYDGDGIADMASYDSTTGEWHLRLSSSDFTLTLARTLGGAGFILPRAMN